MVDKKWNARDSISNPVHLSVIRDESHALHTTYLIADVLRHHALLLFDSLQVFWILPAELWRKRNDYARHPNEKYHHEHSTRGPRMNVIHIRHCPIPANGTEFDK